MAAAGKRWRLFVAVAVPAPVRAALDEALEPLRRRAHDLRWVPVERWHLTLQFLGHLDVGVVPDVEAALAAAAGRGAPFRLTLSGDAGHFDRTVVWAGIAPSAELSALAGAVREELAARDLPSDDRPFKAHLTVARSRNRGRVPRDLTEGWEGPVLSWQVDEVELVRSKLRRGGAVYTPAGRWPLG